MGMVFQHFNLFPHLTVKENLELAPKIGKERIMAVIQKRSTDLLEKIGLYDKATAYPAIYQAVKNNVLLLHEHL